MKHIFHAHHSLIVLAAIMLSANLVIADDATTVPPSTDKISQDKQLLQIKTETIYESSFLPGVRLCEDEEVDYRGDFRKVNCQDEALINEVSTRKDDTYNLKPDAIVSDRVEPNGNIFRINFRRKASIVETTSDN